MTDKERIEALAAALRYALTKRGSAFDYDVWSEMARKALAGLSDSTTIDIEMAVNANLRQALDTVRAERDALKQRLAHPPSNQRTA